MNHEPDCPICHKPLQRGQDIVTCPSCGAPYHRECYAKEGHCLFADKHAAGFEYHTPKAEGAAAAPKSEGGMLCPHCKTVNDASHIFCDNCGAPLHGTAAEPVFPHAGAGAAAGVPPFTGPAAGAFASPFAWAGAAPGAQTQYEGEIEGIPAADWARFIGSSAPIYLARLFGMQRNKRAVSFLFSAFLFSPTYFAYRKMWGWAAISLVATLALMAPQMLLIAADAGLAVPFSLSIATLSTLASVAYYLDLAMRLIFGFCAMLLFRRFATKRIRQLRQESSDAAYQDALVRKGGVSAVGVALVLVALLAASVLVSSMMGDALLQWFNTNGLFF